jgi:hypothetical protein
MIDGLKTLLSWRAINDGNKAMKYNIFNRLVISAIRPHKTIPCFSSPGIPFFRFSGKIFILFLAHLW